MNAFVVNSRSAGGIIPELIAGVGRGRGNGIAVDRPIGVSNDETVFERVTLREFDLDHNYVLSSRDVQVLCTRGHAASSFQENGLIALGVVNYGAGKRYVDENSKLVGLVIAASRLLVIGHTEISTRLELVPTPRQYCALLKSLRDRDLINSEFVTRALAMFNLSLRTYEDFAESLEQDRVFKANHNIAPTSELEQVIDSAIGAVKQCRGEDLQAIMREINSNIVQASPFFRELAVQQAYSPEEVTESFSTVETMTTITEVEERTNDNEPPHADDSERSDEEDGSVDDHSDVDEVHMPEATVEDSACWGDAVGDDGSSVHESEVGLDVGRLNIRLPGSGVGAVANAFDDLGDRGPIRVVAIFSRRELETFQATASKSMPAKFHEDGERKEYKHNEDGRRIVRPHMLFTTMKLNRAPKDVPRKPLSFTHGGNEYVFYFHMVADDMKAIHLPRRLSNMQVAIPMRGQLAGAMNYAYRLQPDGAVALFGGVTNEDRVILPIIHHLDRTLRNGLNMAHVMRSATTGLRDVGRDTMVNVAVNVQSIHSRLRYVNDEQTDMNGKRMEIMMDSFIRTKECANIANARNADLHNRLSQLDGISERNMELTHHNAELTERMQHLEQMIRDRDEEIARLRSHRCEHAESRETNPVPPMSVENFPSPPVAQFPIPTDEDDDECSSDTFQPVEVSRPRNYVAATNQGLLTKPFSPHRRCSQRFGSAKDARQAVIQKAMTAIGLNLTELPTHLADIFALSLDYASDNEVLLMHSQFEVNWWAMFGYDEVGNVVYPWAGNAVRQSEERLIALHSVCTRGAPPPVFTLLRPSL
jgi:hypothetical protein